MMKGYCGKCSHVLDDHRWMFSLLMECQKKGCNCKGDLEFQLNAK